jgi:hypothetical protein
MGKMSNSAPLRKVMLLDLMIGRGSFREFLGTQRAGGHLAEVRH